MNAENRSAVIKVTGRGMIKLRPDTTVVNVLLRGVHKEYRDAVEHSANDTEKLRGIFGKLDFAHADLKTVNFRIDPRYESVRKDDEYKQILAGYEYFHAMKLSFPSDNTLLGRIMFELAGSGLDPEFDVSYTVKDREAAKNRLLEAAVNDAAEKAKRLAGAAGCELGGIVCINYSMSEPDMVLRPMAKMALNSSMRMNSAEAAFDMNIEPDDAEISDTVTVVWKMNGAERAD